MKKTNGILILSLLMLSMFGTFAFAQDTVGDALVKFSESLGIYKLTQTIVNEGTNGALTLTDAGFGFVRFLLVLLIFAVYFWGLGFVFKDRKNINIVISLSLSLLSIFAMPKEWIFKLFLTTGWIIPLIVWGGLFVALSYAKKSLENTPTISGLVMILMGTVLFMLTDVLRVISGLVAMAWIFAILWLVAFIYIVMGIVRLFSGLGGGSSSPSPAGGGRIKKFMDRNFGEEKKFDDEGIRAADAILNATSGLIPEDAKIMGSLSNIAHHLEGMGDKAFDYQKDSVCDNVVTQGDRIAVEEQRVTKVSAELDSATTTLKNSINRNIRLTAKEINEIKNHASVTGGKHTLDEAKAIALDTKKEHLQAELAKRIKEAEKLIHDIQQKERATLQAIEAGVGAARRRGNRIEIAEQFRKASELKSQVLAEQGRVRADMEDIKRKFTQEKKKEVAIATLAGRFVT